MKHGFRLVLKTKVRPGKVKDRPDSQLVNNPGSLRFRLSLDLGLQRVKALLDHEAPFSFCAKDKSTTRPDQGLSGLSVNEQSRLTHDCFLK